MSHVASGLQAAWVVDAFTAATILPLVPTSERGAIAVTPARWTFGYCSACLWRQILAATSGRFASSQAIAFVSLTRHAKVGHNGSSRDSVLRRSRTNG